MHCYEFSLSHFFLCSWWDYYVLRLYSLHNYWLWYSQIPAQFIISIATPLFSYLCMKIISVHCVLDNHEHCWLFRHIIYLTTYITHYSDCSAWQQVVWHSLLFKFVVLVGSCILVWCMLLLTIFKEDSGNVIFCCIQHPCSCNAEILLVKWVNRKWSSHSYRIK